MSAIDDQITVLISTSYIPECPYCPTLDQTIASIRQTLPASLIVIQCDGLADMPDMHGADMARRLQNYAGYRDRLRGRYDHSVVLEYDSNVQQSGMLGRALEYVKTPLISYVEHDWALSPNIEWEKLGAIIRRGQYNLIRFYAYCRIHPLHEGMMFERELIDGVPFVRTIQYSHNPHLASTEFYRYMYDHYLNSKKIAIEEVMHSPCACGPWDRWKLAIYNPLNEGSTQQVWHLDGRKGVR